MLDFASIQNNLLLALWFGLLVMKSFALIDCVARPEAEFTVKSALPKRTWLIILVAALATHFLFVSPISFIGIIGAVPALVYLAQLRGSN